MNKTDTNHDKLISVIDLAKELGADKAYIFKIIDKRLKPRIEIARREKSEGASRGQKIAYITNDDAERIRLYVREKPSKNENVQKITGAGFFYLIKLDQGLPKRFKVGFANDLDARLRQHRTAAPLAKIVASWPCRPLWEKTVIECVTQGCVNIREEVFETEEIDKVKSRCDDFFKLMPWLK